MPRKKKDGRHINYYIDRLIFERLERYADDKGQEMTTAIERILAEHLDKYEEEKRLKGGADMYCERCNLLVHSTTCPVCGNEVDREPRANDYCYLTEKDAIWAGALSDIFENNNIPYVTKNTLGAGLTAKLGASMERVQFFVPYSHYKSAQELEQEFFAPRED